LTRLFEDIAAIVDMQEIVVETHYGPDAMIKIIAKLQKEGDIQSSIIIESFIENRQIQRKVFETPFFFRPS